MAMGLKFLILVILVLEVYGKIFYGGFAPFSLREQRHPATQAICDKVYNLVRRLHSTLYGRSQI